MISPKNRQKITFSNRIIILLKAALALLTIGFSGASAAALDSRQMALFVNNCVQCHASERSQAPRAGIASEWVEAVAKGEESMLINAVQGIGGMPPLGMCSACSEADFRAIIRMMAGLPDSDKGK